MAKKVTVALVDDIDGQTAADETVVFSVDGVAYEIDLASPNADKLRNQLSVWVQHGRKVNRRRRGSAPFRARHSPVSTDREQSGAIREWARKNEYEISSRGRIPAGILDAYNAAN